MTRRTYSAVALAIVLLAAGRARAASPDAPSRLVESSGPLAVGEPAPTFAGWTVDGEMLSLSRLLAPPRGEPADAVVVSFFATWCEPCERTLPLLQRALVAAGPRVRGVLVAHGEDATAVRPFLAERGLAIPTLLDPYLKISQRLGIDKALPRTVVLDGKGTVTAIFEHEGADFEGALEASIADARAKRMAGR